VITSSSLCLYSTQGILCFNFTPHIPLTSLVLVMYGSKFKHLPLKHYMLPLNKEHSVTACRMTLLCLCESISRACNDCSATSMHSIVFSYVNTLQEQSVNTVTQYITQHVSNMAKEILKFIFYNLYSEKNSAVQMFTQVIINK